MLIHGAEIIHFSAIHEHLVRLGFEVGAEGAVAHFQHRIDSLFLLADEFDAFAHFQIRDELHPAILDGGAPICQASR
jgi:hypothetical protein